MTDLQSLAERLKNATGPDRNLDSAIANALGYETWMEAVLNFHTGLFEGHLPVMIDNSMQFWEVVPAWTSSLDAVLALADSLRNRTNVEAVDLLREVLEFGLFCGGWKPNQPTAPQIALALLRALVAALQAQQPEPTRQTGDGHE